MREKKTGLSFLVLSVVVNNPLRSNSSLRYANPTMLSRTAFVLTRGVLLAGGGRKRPFLPVANWGAFAKVRIIFSVSMCVQGVAVRRQ